MFIVERERVLELLSQVLIDALAGLKDGSSVLEALDLLHDEAGRIDFVLAGAVDGDDALLVLLLLV